MMKATYKSVQFPFTFFMFGCYTKLHFPHLDADTEKKPNQNLYFAQSWLQPIRLVVNKLVYGSNRNNTVETI